MADAKLTALTAASALAGADLFYVSQSAASRKATGTQLLALVGTTYVPLAGGVTMTGALTIASGTLTASAPALSITQTWTTGAAFTAALINVTDTSSTAGSLLQDWQVGGATKASVRKSGRIVSDSTYLTGGFAGSDAPSGGVALNFRSGAMEFYNSSGVRNMITNHVGVKHTRTMYVGWTNGDDGGDALSVALYRDGADATLAQRNGTTQQIFRLYNTYTDASNYERLTLTGVAGTSVNITAETLGTGGDNLDIVLTPAGTGSVRTAAPLTIASGNLTVSAGTVTAISCIANTGNLGINSSAGFIYWEPSGNTRLYQDAAATLAQRNGTNAQTLRVYRSYTDASNYSRFTHGWNTSTALLMAEGLGTGTDGNVAFNDAALATGATLGYIMVPSAAGVSTGVPADIPTGQTPIVFDSTNKKIGAYTGGAWVWTAALA